MKKVRFSAIVMLMCVMGWGMTGCGSDDDEPGQPTPSAKFSHVKATFGVKAEGETTQLFDVTGEWECNGDVAEMASLKQNPDQSFSPADSRKLPSAYSLTLRVSPNKSFVPEEGRKYAAKLRFTYDITVVGSNGEELYEKEGSEYVMNMAGVHTDKLEQIAERFPVTYLFTVKQTSAGNYEIVSDLKDD